MNVSKVKIHYFMILKLLFFKKLYWKKKLCESPHLVHFLLNLVIVCILFYLMASEELNLLTLVIWKGEIDQVDLLISYENLIESQTENKFYSEAKKTLKKIKLYKLNILVYEEDIVYYYDKMSLEVRELYHQDNRGLEQFKYGDLPYQD